MYGRYNGAVQERHGAEGGTMEQIVFMICMVLGVSAVALIAFTLLGIVLGKVQV